MNARCWVIALVVGTVVCGSLSARAAEDAVLLSIEGDVTVSKAGAQTWQPVVDALGHEAAVALRGRHPPIYP